MKTLPLLTMGPERAPRCSSWREAVARARYMANMSRAYGQPAPGHYSESVGTAVYDNVWAQVQVTATGHLVRLHSPLRRVAPGEILAVQEVLGTSLYLWDIRERTPYTLPTLETIDVVELESYPLLSSAEYEALELWITQEPPHQFVRAARARHLLRAIYQNSALSLPVAPSPTPTGP